MIFESLNKLPKKIEDWIGEWVVGLVCMALINAIKVPEGNPFFALVKPFFLIYTFSLPISLRITVWILEEFGKKK